MFEVDEYYCTETKTAQACLGYVSLEQLGILCSAHTLFHVNSWLLLILELLWF